MDHGSRIKDHGSWIMDHGSWIMDHGSSIMDHGSAKDKYCLDNVGLGTLRMIADNDDDKVL